MMVYWEMHLCELDKREEAVVTVIEQAEAVCREWGEAA